MTMVQHVDKPWFIEKRFREVSCDKGKGFSDQ